MNTTPITLKITTTARGECRVLSLEGRLDAHQVGALIDAAEPLAPTTRLDLGGVSFMDSSGLASLVRLNRTAAAQNMKLEILNVRDAVRLAMEITGLYAVLPVVDTGPAAGGAAHGSV
ncbi:STAS domain-containing protein [uncultured Deinococcus sp.]|uniref:STAS domain-containing protein n=1 Tax=uncultured Deinococcus sp. TaxID=158789 RepID=UPI0025DFA3BB|nr:STAS domain-containing protein [uncultured Deinococcus sp.]